LVGVGLPLIISVIIKPDWSKAAKFWTAFVFVIMASFGDIYFSGQFVLADIGGTMLKMLFIAFTSYKVFWHPSGITDKIEKNVNPGKAGLPIALAFILLFSACSIRFADPVEIYSKLLRAAGRRISWHVLKAHPELIPDTRKYFDYANVTCGDDPNLPVDKSVLETAVGNIGTFFETKLGDEWAGDDAALFASLFKLSEEDETSARMYWEYICPGFLQGFKEGLEKAEGQTFFTRPLKRAKLFLIDIFTPVGQSGVGVED
jgi:hypothetical protein